MADPGAHAISDASQLARVIDELAGARVLLVASDFDGTLAPIVDDPDDAYSLPGGLEALAAMAQMRRTEVAIVSGRPLDDLAGRVGHKELFSVVGSHGAEFSSLEPPDPLSPELLCRRAELWAALDDIAGMGPGLVVERKPHGAAFHFRKARPELAESASERVRTGPGALPGVSVRGGKMVLELSLAQTDKGRALGTLRERFGISRTLFIGDDRTDEDAFAALDADDVTIKVGAGETKARFRVGSPAEVVDVLQSLASARAASLEASPITPITDHSMLSNGRTVAMVDPSGTVVWWCLPRADGVPVFGSLLDPDAGVFRIAPAEGGQGESSYLDDGFRLQTRWPSMILVDELLASEPAHPTVLRRAVESGPQGCEVLIDFRPSLGLGTVPCELGVEGSDLVMDGARGRLRVTVDGFGGPPEWMITDGPQPGAQLRMFLTPDQRAVIEAVSYFVPAGAAGVLPERPAAPWAGALPTGAKAAEWPDRWRSLAARSGSVLRGLCCEETGAMLAAATVALPEALGCERNWDYRYCWPRDAALAATALVKLGAHSEAEAFLAWFQRVLEGLGSPGELLPIYTLEGFPLPLEVNRTDLRGYDESRPIRLSNGASHQVQLDVFGPIARLIRVLHDRGRPATEHDRRVLAAMVEAVHARWREPDCGIWEVRDRLRHFVHSKTMCWTTVRDATRVLGPDAPAEWAALADEIRRDVLEHGWSDERGSYTVAYDEPSVDASSLWIVLSGLLDADDPRADQTVREIERTLRVGSSVFRYRADDGLSGREGAFHICTGWLVSAMVKTGRRDDARELLEGMLALAGPTGLFSEMHDPRTGLPLGNTPQAYSHLSVIESVLTVADAFGM